VTDREKSSPLVDTLDVLRRTAAECRACDLWAHATQTVFGEGPSTAAIMLVGEQPGDLEDREGHPFVGPAGKVLDEALGVAGIERSRVYVTNAVKHFKWTARGKRRIHDKPDRHEIVTCRTWLDRELAAVHPQVLVTLGASASQSLLGPAFRLTRHQGEVMDDTGIAPHLLATIHPSVVLRARGTEARRAALAQLTSDLSLAATLVA
jgi:uracil-DNA glycosylase